MSDFSQLNINNIYLFSFAAILKKMAANSKQSKLSEKGDECTFTWKVYATWDFGIANVETAHNKVPTSSVTRLGDL